MIIGSMAERFNGIVLGEPSFQAGNIKLLAGAFPEQHDALFKMVAKRFDGIIGEPMFQAGNIKLLAGAFPEQHDALFKMVAERFDGIIGEPMFQAGNIKLLAGAFPRYAAIISLGREAIKNYFIEEIREIVGVLAQGVRDPESPLFGLPSALCIEIAALTSTPSLLREAEVKRVAATSMAFHDGLCATRAAHGGVAAGAATEPKERELA